LALAFTGVTLPKYVGASSVQKTSVSTKTSNATVSSAQVAAFTGLENIVNQNTKVVNNRLVIVNASVIKSYIQKN
jgi:hypothetical protein